jgi:hypothetical protein
MIIIFCFLTIIGMTLWLPKSVHLKVATLVIIPCLCVNASGIFAFSIGAISYVNLTLLATVIASSGMGIATYIFSDKISQDSNQ